MTKSLASVSKNIKPEILAAKMKAKKILATMPLQELRHARQLSQEQLADVLHADPLLLFLFSWLFGRIFLELVSWFCRVVVE
jgi:hypothetical protein